MKHIKSLTERIRRVNVIFKELGYELFDPEESEDLYTAGFDDQKGFQAGFLIDIDSRFLELTFTFSFSREFNDFLQEKLEVMIKKCYEYGCYLNIQKTDKEISFSVFSKLYYSGLSYYSMKDTLREFKTCVADITEIIQLHKEKGKPENPPIQD